MSVETYSFDGRINSDYIYCVNYSKHVQKTTSENDQEIPQSHTADQSTAP